MPPHFSLSHIHTYIYIYIYVCVCVCICVYMYIYINLGVLCRSLTAGMFSGNSPTIPTLDKAPAGILSLFLSFFFFSFLGTLSLFLLFFLSCSFVYDDFFVLTCPCRTEFVFWFVSLFLCFFLCYFVYEGLGVILYSMSYSRWYMQAIFVTECYKTPVSQFKVVEAASTKYVPVYRTGCPFTFCWIVFVLFVGGLLFILF